MPPLPTLSDGLYTEPHKMRRNTGDRPHRCCLQYGRL